MARWIALLRGINVGGRNILPMRDLTATLEQAGCRNVRTYIQSGNVVFDSAHKSAAAAARRVGEAIESNHGFKPLVFVLSLKDLVDAAAKNPYPEAVDVPKSLHVCFLDKKPASSGLARLDELKSDSERLSTIGKVLYLHAPDGIGRSKLAQGVERALGVSATGRNWRTISKLLALAEQAS